MVTISKSDFLCYLQCPAYFWLKRHKPEVVEQIPLSEFEKHIIEQGQEVERWAQKLFHKGIEVQSAQHDAAVETKKYMDEGKIQIFQATFEVDGLYAMVDILEWDEEQQYWIINEVKGSTSKDVKKELHLQDACFQWCLLKRLGVPVGSVQLLELNKEFVKNGEIDPVELIAKTDILDQLKEMEEEVELQIVDAQRIVQLKNQPHCPCVYKGRKKHCPTFAHCNPQIPEYSVHDIARIGNSKKKLEEMMDNAWYSIEDLPDDYELASTQAPQVEATKTGKVLIDDVAIAQEFEKLEYPLYFFDYETCPTAIPLFDGCRPYQQVPFQYSIHIIKEPGGEVEHKEFLHSEFTNPIPKLAEQLRSDMGDGGSVIVWHQSFEIERNKELAEAVPSLADFFTGMNKRIFDLKEIFSKQLYVHKDFQGSASIKNVLPVLLPELSHKDLSIHDGGMAANAWKKLVLEEEDAVAKKQIAEDLLDYCELDTFAMVEILRFLKFL